MNIEKEYNITEISAMLWLMGIYNKPEIIEKRFTDLKLYLEDITDINDPFYHLDLNNKDLTNPTYNLVEISAMFKVMYINFTVDFLKNKMKDLYDYLELHKNDNINDTLPLHLQSIINNIEKE